MLKMKKKKKVTSIIITTAFFFNTFSMGLTNFTSAASAGGTVLAASSQSQYVEDELIVKYKSGVDPDTIAGKRNGKVAKKIGKLRVAKVKIPKGKDPKSEALNYKTDPGVEYAEPNYLSSAEYMPDDPSYSLQWSIPKMKVDQAWNTVTDSSAVTIAVVDTGVDADHPDLTPNLVSGYNTITDTTNTDDDYGHGTHVAGIAAGKMGNSLGISGVSGNSKIMPIKAMGSTGTGSTTDISEGIVWAADHGAKVINLSLGSSTYTTTMQSAVDYAYNAGCIVIAAAGNSNTSALHYPAAMNHVVAVAATDSSNAKASFSNYGSHIDIAAPGTSIYSTTFDGAYGYKQGTSMATPNVAGVAALVWSYRPELTPGQLEALLEFSATDIGTAGKDVYFGYGLVDANEALTHQIDTSAVSLNITSVTPSKIAPGVISKINYNLGKQAYLTLKIKNSSNTVVSTPVNRVLKSVGAGYVTWNGKSSTNVAVASGDYTYELQAEDTSGNLSSVMTGTITVDNTLPVISSLSVSPNPFAPDGSNNADISYNISENGKVSVNIYNNANILVKNLAANVVQSVGSNTLQWNGKNSTNLQVPDGTYKVKVDITDEVGLKGTQQIGTFVVEAATPTISLVSDSPDPFKLTGTSLNTIKYTLSEDAAVNIKIYDSSNNVVRNLLNGPVTIGAKTVAWNGKNDAGALVADGTYTYKINATDNAGKAATEVTGTITTDKSLPIISGLSVSPSQLTAVSGPVTLNYTLSENAKVTVAVYNGTTLVKTLKANIQENGANSITWNGTNAANLAVGDGTYSFKITATDLVGFVAAPQTINVSVERNNPTITAVSDLPDVFKLTGTSLNTIKYTLSENANVTIKIYDSGNNVVRTLASAVLKNGGIQSVTWNGKDDLGILVADGTYTYKIDATDLAGKAATQAIGTIKTDKSAPVISAVTVGTSPFLSYNLSENCKVTIVIYNSSNVAVKNLITGVAQSAGSNTVNWNFTNNSNVIVPLGNYTYKITAVDAVGFSSIQTGSFALQ